MKKPLSILLATFLLMAGLWGQVIVAEAGDTGNTYNGKTIPFSDWVNVGQGNWSEKDGVITADGSGEWLLLQYEKKISGNYTIEFDVKQPDINKNYSIHVGFEVKKGENFTQSGLTFEVHNYGLGRLYDTVISRQSESAYGGCNNGYGGIQTFNPTTEWIHVKIQRVENKFTVEYYDGTNRLIECTLEDYNGGYLVLGSIPRRKVSYKNITIKDNLDVDIEIKEPSFPEEAGKTKYTFDNNKYGEWVASAGTWTADRTAYTQSSEEDKEMISYLDVKNIRNFSMTLAYEVISEPVKDGQQLFGIGFRKSAAESTYQGLGYTLLFKCSPQGNRMKILDYLDNHDVGLDERSHEFELAGTITLSCSGNEIYVWLDDELIANVTSNSYASGSISLFTIGCSVKFSDITITSDNLISAEAKEIIDTVDSLPGADDLTEENRQTVLELQPAYEALNDLQKNLFPTEAKSKFEALLTAAEEKGSGIKDSDNNPGGSTLWYIVIGIAVLLILALAIVFILKNKNSKKTK